MSSDSSSIRWGRVAVGAIVGTLVAVLGLILLQLAFGVVMGFQMRGNPPQDQLIAAFGSPLFLIMAGLVALLGGFVGGRMAALPLESSHVKAGLITGVLVAILVAFWRSISWGVDMWVGIFAAMAILGGWIGGRRAARRRDEDYEESPQL
jgi:hypothetical protein